MGRIGSVLIAGAALFAGMVVQGDVDLDMDDDGRDRTVVIQERDRGSDVDRRVDRAVDRATSRIERDGERAMARADDAATEQAMAAAIAELVRAEASLVTAKLDRNMPAAAIRQAEQRRDLAKQAFESLADQARASRDSNRKQVRDEIRDGIRDAVRS